MARQWVTKRKAERKEVGGKEEKEVEKQKRVERRRRCRPGIHAWLKFASTRNYQSIDQKVAICQVLLKHI